MAELNELSRAFIDEYGINVGNNLYSEMVEGAIVISDEHYEGIINREGPLNFYGAMDVIKNVFANNASQTRGVHFFEEDNESFDKPPVIVFSMSEMEPESADKATYNQKSMPRSGAYARAMMPRWRGIYKNVTEVGQIKMVTGFHRDYNVRLTCYSNNHREANELAFAVEDTLVKFRPVIRAAGIPDIMFLRMGEMIKKDVGGEKLVGRPVDVFLRIDQIFTISVQELLSIRTFISITPDEEQVELDPLITTQE